MKYKFNVKNLDCPNCARKIETHLSKDKNLSNVSLNYTKLTLTFETELENNVKEYVSKKINEIELGVKLLSDEENIDTKKQTIIGVTKIIIGLFLFILGTILKINIISDILIIASYVILLFDVFKKAINLLINSKTLNENMLITISCVGAYLTNNKTEGIMVILLYSIGKILENIAVNNSRKSIADLMDIKPLYANLKIENEIKKIAPSKVKINDVIIIKKGEKVPLDGIVIKGESQIDTSALTGESRLRNVSKDDEILSGSINITDILEIKVTSNYENSTVSRILELVENATDRKAKTENFVAAAAKIYTPIVLILAIMVVFALPTLFDLGIKESIYRALSFLVISCPCAIAISVPLSYFSGIGAASKKGILVKGSDYLDSLKDIRKIIFDKTGTITTGEFDNLELEIINEDYKEKEIIEYFIKGETFSNHPLAKSILKKFNKKVNTKDVTSFKEHTGKGISYKLDNKKILIGSNTFVESDTNDSSIYLKVDKEIIAKLNLTDTIKENASEVIEYLNSQNIKTMMFTGDSKETALNIANKVNIKEVRYELLPENKYKLLEKELDRSNGQKIAFIGDGINDAPSLALADVGISMGSIGSASAIEASDVVIVNDDISKVIDAIKIAKKTDKIIKQNLVFSIGIKVIVLILSAIGISSMWQAVFADTGVTLLAIINTTRILKK